MLLPARALAEIREHAKGQEKLRPPLQGGHYDGSPTGSDMLENWYDDTAVASSLPLADLLHERGILDERSVELLKKAPIGLASAALLALGPNEPHPSAFIRDKLMHARAGGVKESAKFFSIAEVQATSTPPPKPRRPSSALQPGNNGDRTDRTYNSRGYSSGYCDGIASKEDRVNCNDVSGARAMGAGAEPLAESTSSPVRSVYLSKHPRDDENRNYTTPNKISDTRSRRDSAASGWQQWTNKRN
eukprot:TRINITY_DN73683_c0_g1_i1.p1 TRINITY_DN73683_c0_g1~~TRINITY_DN73683_c0_g1_i1.p1  ORF type:complete len:245 (+),score=25.07 TRINITY_DN73683_c0_g1_i1:54-788(+)